MSPTAVIDTVSNSNFKKLSSLQPDNDVLHFMMYSRLKGREIAREMLI